MFVAVARAATLAAFLVGAYYGFNHSAVDMVADVLSLSIAFKCCVIGNIVFWTMTLLCAGLDTMPRDSGIGKAIADSKIQGVYFTLGEWIDTACVAVLNLVVIAPLVCVGYEKLWETGLGGLYVRLHEDDPVDPKRELANLLGMVVIVNVWFYWSHRLIHHRWFYNTIHKIHHRWQAPCAHAAVYAHPVEFVASNIASIALGPLLTNAHPYVTPHTSRTPLR